MVNERVYGHQGILRVQLIDWQAVGVIDGLELPSLHLMHAIAESNQNFANPWRRKRTQYADEPTTATFEHILVYPATSVTFCWQGSWVAGMALVGDVYPASGVKE